MLSENFSVFFIFVCFEHSKLSSVPIKPERSFKEGFGDAELVIFSVAFSFEYSQPLLPG